MAYVLVADSVYQTWETREMRVNYYGRLLSVEEDGSTMPVICGHGGSMWLCRECAERILARQESKKGESDDSQG